jgi:hypothetical protein
LNPFAAYGFAGNNWGGPKHSVLLGVSAAETNARVIALPKKTTTDSMFSPALESTRDMNQTDKS